MYYKLLRELYVRWNIRREHSLRASLHWYVAASCGVVVVIALTVLTIFAGQLTCHGNQFISGLPHNALHTSVYCRQINDRSLIGVTMHCMYMGGTTRAIHQLSAYWNVAQEMWSAQGMAASNSPSLSFTLRACLGLPLSLTPTMILVPVTPKR